MTSHTLDFFCGKTKEEWAAIKSHTVQDLDDTIFAMISDACEYTDAQGNPMIAAGVAIDIYSQLIAATVETLLHIVWNSARDEQI